MRILKRQDILTAVDIITEDVATPEFAPDKNEDGSPLTPEQRAEYGVRIRNLTAEGRSHFLQRSLEMELRRRAMAEAVAEGRPLDTVDPPKKLDVEMLLVAMTAVDGENKLLFTEDDVLELGNRNAAAIARLAATAQRLSGLDAAVAARAVKG